MRMRTPTQASSVQLTATGSSHITLSVHASTSVIASLTGSSVIDIHGTAQAAEIGTHGSARFSGAGLQVDTARVTVSGSGVVELSVSTTVSGRVQGSGALHLKGPRPGHVDVQTSGSGRVENS